MSDRGAKSSRLQEFLANPKRGLWVLSLPMMLGMLVQTTYALVDMLFVGRVSSEALAALAFNLPVLFFAYGIIIGLGNGVTAVVAQYIGAQDKTNADRSAEHAVGLGAVLSAILTLAALLWGRQLLAAVGVLPGILTLAWQYFQVISAGITFTVTSSFSGAILFGEGDMRTPMMIQMSGTILNALLDPIFIFGLGMGIRGAAVATVISQALAAVVYVVILFFKKHSYISFDLANFKLRVSIVGDIFRIGLPASAAFLVMSFGVAVFNKILSSFSGDAVAAYQVGNRLDHIFLLPTLAMASALVTLVGMFHGAGRHELIRQVIAYAMGRAMLIAAAVGTAFFVFAPHIVSIFSDDPEIRVIAASYLRIVVFSYPFIVVSMFSARTLQGLGHGVPMLVLATLRMFLISAPLALVFIYWLEKPIVWVWIAMVSGVMCSSLIGLVWMRSSLRRAALALRSPLAADPT